MTPDTVLNTKSPQVAINLLKLLNDSVEPDTLAKIIFYTAIKVVKELRATDKFESIELEINPQYQTYKDAGTVFRLDIKGVRPSARVASVYKVDLDEGSGVYPTLMEFDYADRDDDLSPELTNSINNALSHSVSNILSFSHNRITDTENCHVFGSHEVPTVNYDDIHFAPELKISEDIETGYVRVVIDSNVNGTTAVKIESQRERGWRYHTTSDSGVVLLDLNMSIHLYIAKYVRDKRHSFYNGKHIPIVFTMNAETAADVVVVRP